MEWPQVIDYRPYVLVLTVIGAAVLVAIGFVYSVRGISYKLTPRRLVIKFLGIPIRCIRLIDIVGIDRKDVWWSEKWHCTRRKANRLLVLRRKRGLSRAISITPHSPMIFRAELVAARNALLPPAPDAPPASASPNEGAAFRNA